MNNVLNLEYLHQVCADDDEMLRDLLEIFLQQSEGLYSSLRSLLDDGDLLMLANEAHKAKSMALSMGLETMADALKKIEVLAKKIALRDFADIVPLEKVELYSKQMSSLPKQIDDWTNENLSLKSVEDLIFICKLQAETAIREAQSLLGQLL